MRAGHAALGFIGFALAASVACAPTAAIDCTDPEVGAQCSAYQDGGTTDGPNVDAPAGCDLTKGPKDSAACIDDSVGVFVSPNGDDGATGNKATPVKSIGAALTLAASRGLPRVYVCEGNYGSATTITAPIAIYGGLSCAWAYTGNLPKLAPAKGVPLTVTGVSAAVTIQDLEFDGAADMNTPGDSAIAAFVSQSMNVTFTNVTLAAGAGVTGGPGSTRSNYTGDSAAVGGTVAAPNGGVGGKAMCTDGTSSTGGNGGNNLGVGLSDGTSNPATGASNAGSSSTTSCTAGNPGGDGAAGAAAVASAVAGQLSTQGWSTTVPASNAPNGQPGQGGGGGGTKLNVGSPGGGGGAGGCGGAGGTAGSPGGSSFALLSFQSTVSVTGASSLTASGGGKGGKGGAGQAGQDGGAAGPGAACDGGKGGVGAGGSGGSGGAGGHSVPIAYVGNAPAASSATLTPGTVGPGGDPGDGGAAVSTGNGGAAGAKGTDGQSVPTLSLAQ